MPHRPAQPGIDPRRRRPDALDQPAENDAVGFGQPRFELAVDVKMRARRFRPPHHAVGEGGLEHIGIIAELHHQAARLLLGEQIVERRRQRRALRALEDDGDAVLIAMTARSALRDGAAPVRRNHTALTRPCFPAAPAPSAALRSAPAPDRVRRPSSFARGSERVQRGGLPAPKLSAARRGNDRSRAPGRRFRPAAACRAAAPVRASRWRASARRARRRAGTADASAAPATSAAPAPSPAASAARRAKMPADVSISASPPESSNSRFQRPSAAITRRASARSGVTSAADLFRCRASRIATAIASASISGLGASTTASFVMPPAKSSAETSGSASRSCHCAVALDGRIVSDTSTSRPMRRRRAENFDIAALDAEAIQQRVHRELRMVRGGLRGELALRVPDAADQSARRPRRDRCRAPAAPPRPAAGWRRRAGISRSPASSRSSPPRSPGRHDARSGARLRPRSGRSRRAAGSIRPISCRCPATPCARCRRNSSECCQYWSSWSGTSLSSAFQSTPRVTMSSISRARSSASASVEAGPPTTSGAAPIAGLICFAHAATRCASVSRRSQFAEPRRNVERRHAAELVGLPRTPVRPRRCRRAPRCAAGSPRRSSARRERSPAPAVRRAGSADRASPAPAVRGSLRASKPSTSRPSTSAAMTVRRNGAETGTLKTRMGCLIRGQAQYGMGGYRGRSLGSGLLYCAYRRPRAYEP